MTLGSVGVEVDATRLTRHTAYHDNLIPKRSPTDVKKNFFSIVLFLNGINFQ